MQSTDENLPDEELDPTDPTVTHIPRVLIVEDTVELGEIIQTALRGMSVLTFHEVRGSTALIAYNDLRPDIVLLDIGLPDMTGWKLLDAIKESQTSARHPAIVVITAYGDPANRLMGKLQGVYSYLIKPFTLDEVRRIIQKILDERAVAATVANLNPIRAVRANEAHKTIRTRQARTARTQSALKSGVQWIARFAVLLIVVSSVSQPTLSAPIDAIRRGDYPSAIAAHPGDVALWDRWIAVPVSRRIRRSKPSP